MNERMSKQNKAEADEADVAIMLAKTDEAEVHTADKTANEVDVKADEADAKATEADAKADTTNKLDELAVAEGRAKGHVVAGCSQCVV